MYMMNKLFIFYEILFKNCYRIYLFLFVFILVLLKRRRLWKENMLGCLSKG